jgi:hypothetical protein
MTTTTLHEYDFRFDASSGEDEFNSASAASKIIIGVEDALVQRSPANQMRCSI